MAEIICKVKLGEGEVDEDYTFYADGKIEHNFDRNTFRFHKRIKPTEIDDTTVQLLLEKCPYGFKERIKAILKKN